MTRYNKISTRDRDTSAISRCKTSSSVDSIRRHNATAGSSIKNANGNAAKWKANNCNSANTDKNLLYGKKGATTVSLDELEITYDKEFEHPNSTTCYAANVNDMDFLLNFKLEA